MRSTQRAGVAPAHLALALAALAATRASAAPLPAAASLKTQPSPAVAGRPTDVTAAFLRLPGLKAVPASDFKASGYPGPLLAHARARRAQSGCRPLATCPAARPP